MTPWLSRTWVGVLALILWVVCLVACRSSTEAPSLPAPPTADAPDEWVNDLRPISSADWGYQRAAHLLERAGFGGTPQEIWELAQLPPNVAVKRLVRYQRIDNIDFEPFPASGIFPSDDFAPASIGSVVQQVTETARREGEAEALGVTVRYKPDTPWLQPLHEQYTFLRFANYFEMRRVNDWMAERMLRTRRPLEEKLALFWHGHFATGWNKVMDYRKMLAQWDLFRTHGNGNFRDLLLGICSDPAMLIYLDGLSNIKGHANENFGREILELFSMGVGNYTDTDIKEASRAFTGWGLDGNRFVKSAAQHDAGKKTFLGQTGNLDGEDIVDIILEQPATALFIAAKLYRFFVREELDPAVNERLAEILRRNEFEVSPLLEAIFLSRDYFSSESAGTQIKSPVHLMVSTYRKLGISELPALPRFPDTARQLGQELNEPPNVAGWTGGRSWLNPATLLRRQAFTRHLLFPAEHPPPGDPLWFVPDIIGQPAYLEMKRMAEQGDYTTFPGMRAEAAGFNRTKFARESFNVFRAVFNGGARALEAVAEEPARPAEIDLVTMVVAAGISDVTECVDYFTALLLRVPLEQTARTSLIDYLRQRLGGEQVEPSREGLEVDLRELVYLVMSSPEFQLG